MLKVITAIEQDGVNQRILTILLDVEDINVDVVPLVKEACMEYINTKEGKAVYEHNSECFNWADFEVNVPNSICEKHGFRKIESETSQIAYDWNEQLIGTKANAHSIS